MAPEVVHKQECSTQLDIWSFGCLLIEMLTASRPWEFLDELQTINKLQKYQRPRIPEYLSPESTALLINCFDMYALFCGRVRRANWQYPKESAFCG